jgi:DNA-binding XRE family transcriptional regulator
MEMQVDIDVIKKQRNNRAWSQTQLADVSGLSVRTIQRIEKTGIASLESVKSFASVFELEVKDIQKKSKIQTHSLNVKFTALLGVIALVLSGLFIFPATAQSIMVDVYVSLNGKELSNIQILNEDSSESEMVITGALKVIFTAQKENDGSVNIATKLYDLSKEQEILISSPSITTKHSESAEIHFDNYVLIFTPHL